MAKFPWRLFLLLGDRVGSTERSLAQRTRTGMLVVHDELGQKSPYCKWSTVYRKGIIYTFVSKDIFPCYREL